MAFTDLKISAHSLYATSDALASSSDSSIVISAEDSIALTHCKILALSPEALFPGSPN